METISPPDITVREIITPNLGPVKVFLQGNFEERQGKTFFITCHDIGTNHRSFYPFIMHPSMQDVRNRSIFLHVCLPGQDDHAPNLPDGQQFPSLDQIGQDFSIILDEFNVKTVIGIGEGAGANIICRFGMAHPNRVLGIILIHCTSTTAGVFEYIKDKVINWKLGAQGMNQTAWEYLTFHKFGQNTGEKVDTIKAYMDDLKQRMNPLNLGRYMDTFLKRSDLSTTLASKLKVDALLVVGSKASNLHTVYTMHQAMSKSNTTLLVVDDVGDAMSEAPQKLARALILFCKGCGVLSGVAIPGMERQRTLSSSMEEADRPRKMSLTKPATVGM